MSVRIDYASDRMRLHRNIIRQRVRFGFFIVTCLFVALALRLAYIQVVKHGYYQAEAKKIRDHKTILLSQRGIIVDRNGVPLAINVAVGDVAADPLVIKDPAAFAADIVKFLPGQAADAIAARIAGAQQRTTPAGKKIRFIMLAHGVSYEHIQQYQDQFAAEKAAHIKDAKQPVNLTGSSVVTRWVRSYPKGTLACHTVGFLTKQNGLDVGEYGIEKSMNAALAGHDGYTVTTTDAHRRDIPGTEIRRVDAKNGDDIQLTIDVNIQRYAEQALAKSVTDHHAESGSCVVIDPKTGEVLAIANMPVFNPNVLKGTTYQQWDNRAVSDLYEPGSTLKSVTLAAVLDAQGLDMQNHHVHCSGQIQIGNHVVHCAKDPPTYGVHGDEDMRAVLKNSCNIGAAQYAMHLGANKLYEYEKAFGFLDRPQIGLPGVQHSHLRSPDVKPWSLIQLANVGFGQGISVTPVQLAAAYCTFANGGMHITPHIVKGMLPQDPPKRIIKPEVAKALLSMLQTVVEEGTGKPAQIEGYNIGGKTGSAQVAEHGHYGGEYIGSFCGIAPLNNPRLVILCTVNKPQGVHWGAVVAAPVVHDVAQQSLWYMNVVRDAPGKLDYADRNKVKTDDNAPAAVAPVKQEKTTEPEKTTKPDQPREHRSHAKTHHKTA
ncbi:MAG: penicillin-binding protein 2 [Capsulimonadaceae bacterium]|nr:penicillin-binding protein 2 [Capsulimonadaceae bacterium]